MTSAERTLLLVVAASVKLLAQRQGLHSDIVEQLTLAIEALSDDREPKEKAA